MIAFGTLPLNAKAVANVATIAGIMTFLRSAIATIKDARPSRNTRCAAVTYGSFYRTRTASEEMEAGPYNDVPVDHASPRCRTILIPGKPLVNSEIGYGEAALMCTL
jgi:hypothetical protein